METIYWIQRFAQIHHIAWVVFGVSIAVTVLVVGLCFMEESATHFDDDKKKWSERRSKCFKRGGWIVAISMLLSIFIPSEKDLYVIYGVGGTIDYIKSNDTAKQLPDKVINALDAWVDKQFNDNDKDE